MAGRRLTKPPNDRLQHARENTPSPSGSGRPMSRRELADAMNQLLARPVDDKYIGKLERGLYRWPSQSHRDALRQALATQSDHELGFYITRPPRRLQAPAPGRSDLATDQETPGTVAEVRRRKFLGDAAAIFAAGAVGWPLAASSPDLDESDTRVDPPVAVAGPALPTALRTQLLTSVQPADCIQLQSLDVLSHRVSSAHEAYQQARYSRSGAPIADVLAHAAGHFAQDSGGEQRRAHQITAEAYILASKLAAKLGDASLAWIAADRASAAARLADDTPLQAVAIYQVACALAKVRGHLADAQTTVYAGLDGSGLRRESPTECSARGSLELLAAVIAGKLGQEQEARGHLAAARLLADALGRDENRLWTGFGPTNVRLHEVAAAVALRRPREAVRLGEELDTSRLPNVLIGRRAQVHVDLAAAWAQAEADDARALLHLLEAERLAAEVVEMNHAARTTVRTLLARERRSRTPGLVALAQRAGVAA